VNTIKIHKLIAASAIVFNFSILFSQTTTESNKREVESSSLRQDDSIVGHWLGSLSVGPMTARLAFDTKKNSEGKLEANLVNLDLNTKAIDIESTTFIDGELDLKLPSIRARYKGSISLDGNEISGTFSQRSQKIPLKFSRVERSMALSTRPQDPTEPFPYESQEVTFRNETDQINLAGTLTIPHGDGPFAAALLVSGSGPQDRDGFVMGHRPFLVIADHLARHGIASLRFDDRGFGKSEGNHLASKISNFSEDAEAGITFLSKQPKIKPASVGIIGHSEGALIGSMVAAQQLEELDFLILLTPAGEPFFDAQIRQSREGMKLMGASDELIDRFMSKFDNHFERIMDSSISGKEIRQAIKEELSQFLPAFTEEELKLLGFDLNLYMPQIRGMSTPWYRSVIKEAPSQYVEKIKIPTLAIFGELDRQADSTINSQYVKEALRRSGNQDYHTKTYLELNHLLQHAKTGAIAEYGKIEETFAPEVLQDICAWVSERF